MNADSSAGSQSGSVRLDVVVSEQEASAGVARVIQRGGKRLEVKIPARTRTGQTIRLRNAMRITDGRDGDILVVVRVQTVAGGVLVVTDASFAGDPEP